MVWYEYRAKDGETTQRDLPMGTAPETIRVGKKVFQRVFTAQKPMVTGRAIVGYSLPDRRVMPEELHRCVDSWSPEGAPVFTSRASARRFSEESRRLHTAGKLKQEWHFGDVPTGAEVREARELAKKKHRAEMLKKPRPKNL